jgi:Calcium binding protein from Anabaena CcbP.
MPNSESRPQHAPARETRIYAHSDPEVRALDWYYYLQDAFAGIRVKYRCRHERSISPLKKGDLVTVLGMAPSSECMREMFVMIQHAEKQIAVPLSQLELIGEDVNASEAIND